MPLDPEPQFLELEEILEIHADQLKHYGGSAGIRDMGLLRSAIAMPRAQFGEQFLHASLFEMAAAYLFHLVQNHPFIDGNKRVGATAADIFLAINGIELTADERAYEKIVLSAIQGKIGKAELADFLRRNSRSSP